MLTSTCRLLAVVPHCACVGYIIIRPLALGRKNFLFAGNHDAAVRAAIVYSLFSSCKAAGIEPREWLEDILIRLPSHKGSISELLPGSWQALPTTTR